jgi:hypothetical protein
MSSELGLIGTATGTLGLVVGISLIVYKFFKNSKCRSRCCGCINEMDIELETPKHGTPLEGITQEKTPIRTPELKSVVVDTIIDDIKI